MSLSAAQKHFENTTQLTNDPAIKELAAGLVEMAKSLQKMEKDIDQIDASTR